jgi:hypothetical protein
MGAAGAGALLGAIRLAQRAGMAGIERIIGGGGIAGGIGLVGFAASPSLWLALPVLVLVGFSLTTLVSSCNAYIQTQVDDAMRGRVMALFSVVFIGLTPFGNLAAGALAHHAGAPRTVALFGLACAAAGAIFLHRAPRLAA